MAAEEKTLQNEFIEPEEDFLADAQFPAMEDDVFRKRPAAGRRLAGRKRKIQESPGPEEVPGASDISDSLVDELTRIKAPPRAASAFEAGVEVKAIKFPELENSLPGAGLLTSEMFDHIPVQVKVILGSSALSLKDVLELSENSIVTLEKLIGDSLDLVINDQIIAQGEVVVVDGNYGLKITRIVRKK